MGDSHASVPEVIAEYVASIDPAHRPLFDRIHAAVVGAVPDVEVAMAYNMPTYRAGSRRLHVATWSHGVSVYGWAAGRDGGFSGRHPDLLHGKGTIRFRADDLAVIDDDELRRFVAAVLGE